MLLDDTTRPAGAPTTVPTQAGAAASSQPVPQAAARAAGPAGRPATAAPTTAPPTTDGTPSQNLSSEQLLNQLLGPAGAVGPAKAGAGASGAGGGPSSPAPLRWDKPIETDRTGGAGAVKPGAPVVTLLREGHYLTDRMGRLARGAGGTAGRNGLPTNGKAVEFILEADGKALRDPPLIIMPCSKLLVMQATVAAIGRDARFRLSGTVTEYRGRNYILPEKLVLVPDVVQSF